MTPSQRAKEKCRNYSNKSTIASKAAECCCMVAPWVIEEQNRSYKLKITKPKQQEFNGKTKTVSENEPHSNEKKNRYELQIVAPPVDKDGNVTYKKITSKHTFLHKCGLTMLVRSNGYEKSIAEGGSFEIDSDGRIKGAMKDYCGDTSETCHMLNPDEFDTLSEYVDAAVSCIGENVTAAYLKSIEAQEVEEPEDEKSDLEIVLSTLINPVNASKKITIRPTGSTKCEISPKAELYVYPSTKADGGFSFYYQKAHKNELPDRKSRVEVTTSKLEVKGKFNLYYGSKVISFEGSQSAGGHTFVRKKKPHERNAQRAGKNIFSTAEKILGYIKKIEKAHLERSRSLEVSSKAVEDHPMIKFDPGKTGFALAVKNHQLQEIDDAYKVDYKSDMSLNLQILNNVSITVDCISFVIQMATGKAPRVAQLLSKAREKLDKGVGWSNLNIKGGAVIELSVKGGINGTLSWKKELQKPTQIREGKTAGIIGFGAEAHVYAEAQVLFVTIKGEAGGIAASAIKASIPSQFTLKGSLKEEHGKLKIGVGADFTGLALYYVLKRSIDYKKDATDKDKGDGGGLLGGAGSRSAPHKSEISKETKGKKLVLIEAWDDKAGENDAYVDVEQFLS